MSPHLPRKFAVYALLCGLVVLGLYSLLVSSAQDQFRASSALEARVLSEELGGRVRLLVSALEMFANDPHVSTYLADDGDLPPYSRRRIEPAIALLKQNLPVKAWAVASFQAGGAVLLVEPISGVEPMEALLADWAQNLQPQYRVQGSGPEQFVIATPVTHRGQVVGCILLWVARDALALETSDFQVQLQESRSGIAFGPFQPQEFYQEQLPLEGLPERAGLWQVRVSRSDDAFWAGTRVAQLRVNAMLGYLLSLAVLGALLGLEQRQAALEISRAKSELLSTVSHELRAPLGGIVGLTHLTLETPLTPLQKEYLGSVADSAQSALSLLNDLLDHSKMEAGALEFTAMPISLQRVVEEALQTFPARPEVELRTHFGDGLPSTVLADPLRLKQLLLNLVSNALKFTEQGEVVVQVDFEGLDSEGQARLKFGVRDTGCGIAACQLESIFEPFQQADPQVVQRHGGTGLGLSICREFVHRMGGELEVESSPGEGSRFFFTLRLPLVESEIPSPEAARQSQGLRLLLAEDGEINRRLGHDLLEEMGHQVVLANNGKEALELARSGEHDLILMDLKMPGMGGLEVTRQLRSAGVRTPIVALTGSVSKGDREACLEAGMQANLVKPLTRRSFVRVTRQILPDLSTEQALEVCRRVEEGSRRGSFQAPSSEQA